MNPQIGECPVQMVRFEDLTCFMNVGSALTFSQMLFITLQSLPTFVSFSGTSSIPSLKPRQVPLKQWALQVVMLTSGSLLNNWAYAYNVPLTLLIVFRSGGKPPLRSITFSFVLTQHRPRNLYALWLRSYETKIFIPSSCECTYFSIVLPFIEDVNSCQSSLYQWVLY